MINVSDKAKNKIKLLMNEDGFDPNSDFVRVGVKSGGCSGLSYDLKFDKDQKDGDKEFESNGIKIVVDTKSFLYLIGTTLEYSGGLNGTGFVFTEPTAESTLAAIKRGIGCFTNDPASFQSRMNLGMRQRFSWENTATQYENIYSKALKTPVN